MIGIQIYNVIAARRADGLYELRQRLAAADVPIEGPYDRQRAELRVVELAREQGSDGWIEEMSGVCRYLEP